MSFLAWGVRNTNTKQCTLGKSWTWLTCNENWVPETRTPTKYNSLTLAVKEIASSVSLRQWSSYLDFSVLNCPVDHLEALGNTGHNFPTWN